MKTFAHFVTIYAPTARVWEVLSDIARWPDAMAPIDTVQRLDTAAFSVGSRVRLKHPGLPASLWTITSWKPGRSFTWQTRSIGLRVTARHRIVDAPSACKLELHLQIEGWLAPVVGAFSGRLIRRHLAMEAAGLKSASEMPHQT